MDAPTQLPHMGAWSSFHDDFTVRSMSEWSENAEIIRREQRRRKRRYNRHMATFNALLLGIVVLIFVAIAASVAHDASVQMGIFTVLAVVATLSIVILLFVVYRRLRELLEQPTFKEAAAIDRCERVLTRMMAPRHPAFKELDFVWTLEARKPSLEPINPYHFVGTARFAGYTVQTFYRERSNGAPNIADHHGPWHIAVSFDEDSGAPLPWEDWQDDAWSAESSVADAFRVVILNGLKQREANAELQSEEARQRLEAIEEVVFEAELRKMAFDQVPYLRPKSADLGD